MSDNMLFDGFSDSMFDGQETGQKRLKWRANTFLGVFNPCYSQAHQVDLHFIGIQLGSSSQ